MGSDLTASLVDPAAKLKPIPRATFMHRLTETFVRVADQVDRAVTFAAVGTGIVRLQPDYFVAVYGFRVMVLF
jgi:hypothetical protein